MLGGSIGGSRYIGAAPFVGSIFDCVCHVHGYTVCSECHT
jgi:hypothetical protein